MKLKRRIKSRSFIIDVSDPQNPKGRIHDTYEEYLEEGWFKKVIKNPIFISNVFCLLWNIGWLIPEKNKLVIIFFSVLASFNSMIIYKTIKTEYDNDNN